MFDCLAPDRQESYLLTHLYQDVFMYFASFLNGKELANLSVVLPVSRRINLEKLASHLFEKRHPYLALQCYDVHSMPLIQAHAWFTGNGANNDYYFYYLTTCTPTVQLIDSRFKVCAHKTDFRLPNHIHYFTEKIMNCGSVLFLVRSLQYLRDNIHFQKYLKDPDNMVRFIRRLRCYGCRMLENTLPKQLEEQWLDGDFSDVFRKKTKLYLYTYFKDLVSHYVGYVYNLLIHAEMTECIEEGLVDLVTEYRKIGAVIRPDCTPRDMQQEEIWCVLYKELQIPYVPAVIWENVKNPQLVTWHERLTKDLLQRKLDAIIAAYSVGSIQEWEKLQDLQYITQNEHYTVKQMVDFGTALLKLDGVKCYIKNELASWCSLNA